MSVRRKALAATLLAPLLPGCEVPLTQMVVGIDTNLAWGVELRSVVVQVRRVDARGELLDTRVTPAAGRAPPLWITVVANDRDERRPLWVEVLGCAAADGCSRDTALVAQRAVGRFRPRATTELRLTLARACAAVRCAADQRCDPARGCCDPLGDAPVAGDFSGGLTTRWADAATESACADATAVVPTDAPTNDLGVDAGLDASASDLGAPPTDVPRDLSADVATDVEAPLPPPRPLAPLSLGEVSTSRPTLRWALPAGVSSAHVQVCRDRSCAQVITEADVTGASWQSPTPLPLGAAVFWRVRAAAGAAPYGPVWRFRVPQVAPTGAVDSSGLPHLDVDGDGRDELAVGAPGTASNAGSVQLFASHAGAAPTSALRLDGPRADARFGAAVAALGDVNGDGYGELAVAAPGANAVTIYWGGAAGLSATRSTALTPGATAPARLVLSPAGDVDGDGYADLLVAALAAPTGAAVDGAGEVWLYFGAAGAPSTLPRRQLFGTSAAGFGASLSGGADLDGDGRSDFVVGAPEESVGGAPQAGAAYVFLGSADARSGLTARVRYTGTQSPERLGAAVALAGDLNGDGFADLALGAPWMDAPGIGSRAGRVLLYAGGVVSATPMLTPLPALDGGTPSEGFGGTLAAAGDVNGDGRAELLVASVGDGSSPPPGISRLFFGGAASPTPCFWEGVDPVGGHRASLAGVGDLDGDGRAEVAVGLDNTDLPAMDAGEVRVYRGGANACLEVFGTLRGGAANARFGGALACRAPGMSGGVIRRGPVPFGGNVTMADVGDVLGNKYRLDRLLGEGGMGAVFASENLNTGRRVAVKVLRGEWTEHTKAVKRFIREARATTAVPHPNVVEVLDLDTDPEKWVVYIVQEFLVGQTLEERLADAPDRRLSPREAVALLLPVMEAVEAAHARGIVHRDLKPANLFLVRGRDNAVVPKVIDFGIAKDLESVSASHATREGTVIGTPAYMSPEQIVGRADVDARTDVWSLGVVLYEMLSGRLPFEADHPNQLMAMVLYESPPSLHEVCPDVPRALSAIVHRALATDRDQRFPTVRDLRTALLGYASDAPDVPDALGFADTRSFRPTPTLAAPPTPAGGAPTLAAPTPPPPSAVPTRHISSRPTDALLLAPRRSRRAVIAGTALLVTAAAVAGLLARRGPAPATTARVEAPATPLPTPLPSPSERAQAPAAQGFPSPPPPALSPPATVTAPGRHRPRRARTPGVDTSLPRLRADEM